MTRKTIVLKESNFFGFKSKQREKIFQWLIGVVFLALLFAYREPVFEIVSLVKDKEGLIAHLEQSGTWAPILLITVIMLQVVIASIPGHLLMVAGGYIYGFTSGFLLSYISTIIASQFTFYLARNYGRAIVDRFADTKVINKWEKFSSRQGFSFFLFAMTIPIFPTDVIPYLAGLGKVNWKSFAAANLVGRLPVAIAMTMVGSHGLELSPITIGILVILSVAMFIIIQKLSKKAENHYIESVN